MKVIVLSKLSKRTRALGAFVSVVLSDRHLIQLMMMLQFLSTHFMANYEPVLGNLALLWQISTGYPTDSLLVPLSFGTHF